MLRWGRVVLRCSLLRRDTLALAVVDPVVGSAQSDIPTDCVAGRAQYFVWLVFWWAIVLAKCRDVLAAGQESQVTGVSAGGPG